MKSFLTKKARAIRFIKLRHHELINHLEKSSKSKAITTLICEKNIASFKKDLN